jgi:hypothetical protein
MQVKALKDDDLMLELEENSIFHDNFNMTHHIHAFNFEGSRRMKKIRKRFSEGNLSPLDDSQMIADKNRQSFFYYLNVVPTQYQDIEGKKKKSNLKSNQFTVNKNSAVSPEFTPSSVYFK